MGQEVDWDLEMGAIVRRVCEKQGPSPYFRAIKDYPGFEAFGAPLATYRKLAIALGLPADSPIPLIGQTYTDRTSGRGVKPIVVERDQAPCKGNVFIGEEASLFDLPAPMVHDGDGGRYLSTWHMVVSREPDTGDINWGMYRQMVFDEKTMVGPVLPFSDMGKMFYNKHVPRNEPHALRHRHRHGPAGRHRRLRARGYPRGRVLRHAHGRAGRSWSSARPTTCWCRPTPRSSSRARCCPASPC